MRLLQTTPTGPNKAASVWDAGGEARIPYFFDWMCFEYVETK